MTRFENDWEKLLAIIFTIIFGLIYILALVYFIETFVLDTYRWSFYIVVIFIEFVTDLYRRLKVEDVI